MSNPQARSGSNPLFDLTVTAATGEPTISYGGPATPQEMVKELSAQDYLGPQITAEALGVAPGDLDEVTRADLVVRAIAERASLLFAVAETVVDRFGQPAARPFLRNPNATLAGRAPIALIAQDPAQFAGVIADAVGAFTKVDVPDATQLPRNEVPVPTRNLGINL